MKQINGIRKAFHPIMISTLLSRDLIAGSTDYHLGGFRAVTPDKFRAQYTRPLVLGTRAHMLAMYVVLENANAMVCDYPEAYEGQPGFDFIQQVPVTWDKTKVPAGIPDEYIVVARKQANTWWIGGISGNSPRTLKFNPVTAFGEKNFMACDHLPGRSEITIQSERIY